MKIEENELKEECVELNENDIDSAFDEKFSKYDNTQLTVDEFQKMMQEMRDFYGN